MRPPIALVHVVVFIGLVGAAELAQSQRQVSPEAQVFRRLRAGVATVFADGGHGSAFLIDSLGLLLTNEHVVGGGYRIRVKFDDSTRVEAQLVLADNSRDIAVLRVNSSVVESRPLLPLATPSDTMLFEGERVIAIGSPLNQEKIMTAGIVSKIEPRAVITDVNINHGNSGGPLINMAGEVVAINTFGDFTDQGGPGVSGSVLISEALGLLDRARMMIDTMPPPSGRRMAVEPREAFPIDSLRAVAEVPKFDQKPYFISERISTGKFNVVASTPVLAAWQDSRLQTLLSQQTKRREQRKGATETVASTNPARDLRNWLQYSTDRYIAVVTLEFTPKVGETAGSIFGNILGAAVAGAAGSTTYRSSRRYEFKADFSDVRVFRDSLEIEDTGRYRIMQPLVFSSSDWSSDASALDQARTGIFQCTSDWFAPDGDRWPKIRVQVTSVEKPDKPYVFAIPELTVRRIWNDFRPFRAIQSTP